MDSNFFILIFAQLISYIFAAFLKEIIIIIHIKLAIKKKCYKKQADIIYTMKIPKYVTLFYLSSVEHDFINVYLCMSKTSPLLFAKCCVN